MLVLLGFLRVLLPTVGGMATGDRAPSPSPAPGPKVWMTPAEEAVAITALLVQGREKLIDYVSEEEMEGVGIGRPNSPARKMSRSKGHHDPRPSPCHDDVFKFCSA